MLEYKILNNLVDYMELNGITYKSVNCSIDKELLTEINIKNNTNYSLEDLKKATDICISNEWLEGQTFDKYSHISITQKGVGVVRSKRISEELKNSRSKSKIVSDYIEEHKGLFILLGALIGIVALIWKILGSSK